MALTGRDLTRHHERVRERGAEGVREREGGEGAERVRERGREGVRKRKVDRCGILRAVAISKQRWECGSARL